MKKTTSINRNLTVGLIAIIVFFILQAAGVLTMGRYTEREVVEVARRNTVAQVDLADLSTMAQQIRRYEKEYFIYVNNPEKRTQYQKEWTGTMEKITALLGRMRANSSSALSADDLGRVGQWAAASEFYAAEMTKVFAEVNARANKMQEEAATAQAAEQLAASNKGAKAKEATPVLERTRMLLPDEANDLIKAGKDRFSAELIKGVTTTFAQKSEATLALTTVTNEGFNKMIYGVMASVLIGIGIGGYLLISLPKSVTEPIHNLTTLVDAMSRGEPTKPVASIKVQEFKNLSAAVERMRIAQELMLQRLQKPR
jgi:HAMP domain-containing protein/DNA-binding transcriptional regulator of glucitol operon